MKPNTLLGIRTALLLLAIGGICAILANCSVTMNPDGSKAVSVDPGAAVAIGKIIAEK